VSPRRFRIAGWVVAALLLSVAQPSSAQAPSGEVTVSFHVTLTPSWFDPSTAPPQITPFGILYAVHDALVRPLPGQKMGPSLAESWTESADGVVYEFKLRRGLIAIGPWLADHTTNAIRMYPLPAYDDMRLKSP